MNDITKLFKQLNDALFSEGDQEFTVVELIDYEKKHFGAIEGDEAWRIDTGDESIYLIIYSSPLISGIFPKMKHPNRETGTVLKGEVTIETPSNKWTVKRGMPFTIEAGELHKVWIEKGTMLSLQFDPPFESGKWEGES